MALFIYCSFSNTCYTMKAPASSPTSEYIDPVYSSINRHVSSNSNLKSILSKESDPKSEHCKRSEVVSFQLDQGDKPIYHYEKRFIEQRANTAPSSIMISKASQPFSAFEQRSNSPTFSIASKFGSEDSNLEREFIKRTYEKYQSLTPFKTPLGSEHVIIEEDIPDKKAANNRSPITSRRLILQESKQNLNQYLPDENQRLLSNASFTTRSLSPSRSMFIRQQKQPSEHLVPGEIIVSQISLNPSRTKLQNNSERSILSSDRRIRNKMIQVLETIKSPVLGPPPTPNIYYKIEDSIDMVSKANDSAIAISIGEINTAGIKKISITKSVSSDSTTEPQNSEAGLKPSLLKFEDLVQKEEDEELLRVHTFLSDESNILEENCSNTKIKSTESNKQTSSFAKERPGNMHFDQNVLGEDSKLVLYPEHSQISPKKSSDSDISKISESKSTSDVTETSQSKSTQDLNENTDKASDLMESHYQNIDNVDSSMEKEKKESLKPTELIKSFESKLSLHFMPAIGGENEPTNVVNEVTSSSNVMDQLVKSRDEITEPITAKESTNTNLDKNSREAAQLSDEVNVDRHLQFPSLADPSVSQDHASSPVSTETVISTITSTNTVIGASTSNHLLPTEKSSSVLKEFEMNLTKSVSFGEIKYQDFTEGLALDLELDEEIMKAMNETEFALESFISDD